MTESQHYIQDNQLEIEQRRASLYASLLRAAPEATYFRERALDHVVLSGLWESSEANPMKAGIVERNLYKDSRPFTLRVETVKKTLDRLVQKGLVGTFTERKKPVYYLTEMGCKTLEKELEASKDFFTPVIDRLLKDIDPSIPHEVGAAIIRHFILECFAQFGRQIANSVLGQTSKETLANNDEVYSAFQNAIANHDLEACAVESLEYQCTSFLKSNHPQDENLKFHLTQSYYLLEILGANGTGFDPLAEQTFNGSVFYLDTNVVISGLLSYHQKNSPFKEMISLAKRLGIELTVTGTTLQEASVVTNQRFTEIDKFIRQVPEKIKDLAHDDFLESYLAACEQNPTLTLEEFFTPLTNAIERLTEWGIVVVDKISENLISQNPRKESIGAIIQEEAFNARGREKKPNILRHDLGHFILVMEERKQNPKVWFLTNDRSLEIASK